MFDFNSILFLDKINTAMKYLQNIITAYILKNKNKVVVKENLLLNVQEPNSLDNLSIYLILSSEEINSP